jgi:hypothetical protein
MSRHAHGTFTAAVGDENLWRTNPVWCVDCLVAAWRDSDDESLHVSRRVRALVACLAGRGVRINPDAQKRWAAQGLIDSPAAPDELPTPGVVGLVIDRLAGVAWVAPLEARPAAGWSVAANLPIRPATVLQDLLVRTILALGLPQGEAVPERFAFEVRDRLGLRSDGPSMHVAGLLAVLGAANHGPPLLGRACAVVQTEGNAVAPVGSARAKLEAFVREYGRGTLLVRAAGCPESAAFDGAFAQVWEVDSLRDLAGHADRAGLLRVFLESLPLGPADLAAAGGRLRELVEVEHRYAEALDLARRLDRCPCRPEVPARPVREVRRALGDLYRHLGYYEESEELAVRECAQARATPASCYDEQAQADAVHAASLYDPHRFLEMEQILRPWCERLAADPLLVAPETRVMVFNTLARALVILGRAGWAALFRQSLDLLRRRNPTDAPRTWNYLAHGLLRSGRTDEAAAVLADVDGQPAMSDMSRWAFRFLQAEHARQAGRVSACPEMEAPAETPKRLGHPFGFYFQATARQAGRLLDDARGRFRRARECFVQDAGPADRPNILYFLVECMRLAEAAWADDARLWDEARQELGRHLRPRAGCLLGDYYAAVWPGLGPLPNKNAAEIFLRRVPYF